MEHVPVRDQGALGICFAYSGSDLIDAYRFSHGEKDYSKLTSPLACAVETSAKIHRKVKMTSDGPEYPFENGDACPLINKLRPEGSCDLKAMNHALGADEDSATQRLNKAFELYRSRRVPAAAIICRNFSNPQSEAAQIKGALLEDAPLRYFQYEVARACPLNSRLKFEAPLCQETVPKANGDFIRTFNKHFDQLLEKAQPMEIGYCADLLEKGRSFSGVVKNNRIRPLVHYDLCKGYDAKDPEDDGAHSSTVIGRRLAHGKCQLLIKNSYGTSCNDYSSDWDCEGGKIWVDEETLARNVTSYSTLGPP